MFNQQARQRERSARVRGWIVYLLSKARPQPLPFTSIWQMLDRQNLPVTRRKLAEEIDYLRSRRLIRIFPANSDAEVSVVEQAKLTQRFAECESDSEMGVVLHATLTTEGVDFQDGIRNYESIARIE